MTVKDLSKDAMLPTLKFDYVVDCSGHFATPNVPSFNGIETFPGLVLHSHDVKHAENFKGNGRNIKITPKCIVQIYMMFQGQRLLLIGAFLSGEDLAIQTIKFGAKSVTLSHRTRALGSNFGMGVEERPLVTGINGKEITFKDGTLAEVSFLYSSTYVINDHIYVINVHQ